MSLQGKEGDAQASKMGSGLRNPRTWDIYSEHGVKTCGSFRTEKSQGKGGGKREKVLWDEIARHSKSARPFRLVNGAKR